MKTIITTAFLSLLLISTAGPAFAGKPDGAKCHVSKSCRSHLCVRESPQDKFGSCCTPQSCAELGAQCGSIDNGCGIPMPCGECDPGSSCEENQCVANTTTTSTTTEPTTTTTLENPCDPNPCTSCGPFGFFWCVVYDDDGSQQCIYNATVASGECESNDNCMPGERCAYSSTDGKQHCIEVTGVCPDVTTTTTTLPSDNPCIPDPCTSCGGIGFFWCVAYVDDGSQQCVYNQTTSSGGCESDADCSPGLRCAYNGSAGAYNCLEVTGVCP